MSILLVRRTRMVSCRSPHHCRCRIPLQVRAPRSSTFKFTLCVALLHVLLLLTNAVESKEKQNIAEFVLSRIKKIIENKLNKKQSSKPTVVDDFLTPNEASYLLDRYEFLMKDSLSVGYVSTKASHSRYRTSRSVRLPPLGDSIMFSIERRAAELAGFNHSYCEDIQMACYQEGELHGLHRDDADATVNADRAATVLIYLRSPGDGGGGETLFTMKEIEKERDLKTGGPLTSEDGALDLFKSYCEKPKNKQIVVAPEVGRAVTWRNWHGDTFESFATKSTHGACPVKTNSKCVIQQWISRKNKLPLRDERVAAIFTAGVDLNYRKVKEDESDDEPDTSIPPCLTDASAIEGNILMKLCATNDSVNMKELNDGPYGGVGALAIRGDGGLISEILPDSFLTSGLTVSFWARNISVGRTILSIGDDIALVYVDRGEIKQIFELRASDSTQQLKVYSTGSNDQWYWFSVAFSSGSMINASIYSRGQLDGSASIDLTTCEEGSTAHKSFHILPPNISTSISDDTEEINDETDISFVVVHQAFLDDTAEVLQLGQQAKRYDKNS